MRCAHLRGIVFGGEQNSPVNLDIDEHEETARHFLAMDGTEYCAAARWRIPEPGIARLERIVVHPNWRKKGIGHRIVRAMLDDVEKSMPECRLIRLCAQDYAIPFYQRLGFAVVGDGFLDETDYPHHWMEKPA